MKLTYQYNDDLFQVYDIGGTNVMVGRPNKEPNRVDL